jgi:hypothetical protein
MSRFRRINGILGDFLVRSVCIDFVLGFLQADLFDLAIVIRTLVQRWSDATRFDWDCVDDSDDCH